MTSLRHWLRRSPQPSRLRADGRDLAIPATPYKWAELAETIEGLGATRIEALGPDGQVLRALSLEAATPEVDPAAAERAEQLAAGERAERAERDRVRDAAEIARVISDASDRAVMRHTETFGRVLERYEALVSLTVQRLAIMERGYHQAMIASAQAQREAILARAEQEASANGDGGSLLPALIQAGSMLLGPASPSPEPPPPTKDKKLWKLCCWRSSRSWPPAAMAAARRPLPRLTPGSIPGRAGDGTAVRPITPTQVPLPREGRRRFFRRSNPPPCLPRLTSLPRPTSLPLAPWRGPGVASPREARATWRRSLPGARRRPGQRAVSRLRLPGPGAVSAPVTRGQGSRSRQPEPRGAGGSSWRSTPG